MAAITQPKITDLNRKLVELRQSVARSKPGGLKSKNVNVRGRRTSMRLEEDMWEALEDIARREEINKSDLLDLILDLRPPTASFTSTVRSFLITYYRSISVAPPVLAWALKEERGGSQ